LCSYLTGSYQASFIIGLSLITSNTGGQSKKMIVAGMIWFGSCLGSIVSPFFYKTSQAPTYQLGIASLLVANFLQFILFIVFRYVYIWENRRKENYRAEQRQRGIVENNAEGLNATAFRNLTDKENPNFVYVY
jgi:hypothetical protein